MKYSILKERLIIFDEYRLVPLRKKDILPIKKWRNEQMTVLRQNKILTDRDQIRYYEQVIEPSFSQEQPKIVLFSYLLKNICIGYGGLTNIDWVSKRAELSFLLNTLRISNKTLYDLEFSNFLALIKKVAFDGLNFNRVFTETFDFRSRHISVLGKNGFRFEGRMKEHVIIENRYVDSLLHGFLRKYQDDI